MTGPALRHWLAFPIGAFAFTWACAAVPPGVPAELLKQLRQDVPDVRDCEPQHDLPFRVDEVFLGAEGRPQYLLTSTSSCMCGQVNCSEWVYRRGPQKWELLLETQGFLFTVRPTAHNGYRDVETRSRDNAARVDTLRYVFDGQVYRAADAPRPSVRAVGAGTTRRVQFVPGTSSIQLQGRVSSHDPQNWTLGARKAQTLRVSLVDPGNPGIGFTVLGPASLNGRPLTASTTRWEGALPETGTYTIVVESSPDGPAAYTLGIEVR